MKHKATCPFCNEENTFDEDFEVISVCSHFRKINLSHWEHTAWFDGIIEESLETFKDEQ